MGASRPASGSRSDHLTVNGCRGLRFKGARHLLCKDLAPLNISSTRSTPDMRIAFGLGLVATMALSACAAEGDDPLSYEEFKAQVYQDPESGVFVIDGDEP